MKIHNLIAAVFLCTFALTGCFEEERGVKIGAKNFGESRILAHMMLAMAEKQRLPVDGVVDYASTQAVMEALKRGDIDAYPDYNGTGLVMLGQNPIADGDAAMARVKELYEPLGVSWRARFGFASDYGLVMRAEKAAELRIASMSELVSRAKSLTIGIEDDFEKRPLDGFQPMVGRYGLSFGSVDVTPLSDRVDLYEKLLDGKIDVAEIYTTDGQIVDYGLVLLKDDLQFFPAYQAVPVASSASLATYSGLGAALDALGGKIDADLMQDLNRKVEIEGRSPQAVARDALARLNLIDSGAVIADDPLLIASSPAVGEGQAANAALRAARNAFRGRDVQVAATGNPLEAIASGKARLAMLGADGFFDISTPAPTRDDRFEAVAVVGRNLVHVVTGLDGPTRLDGVKTFAVGPVGSSSQKIASILASGLGLSAKLSSVDGGSTGDLVAAVVDGKADAAVVPVPEGDKSLINAMAAANSLRLIQILGWSDGANLVRYPFLREARIAGGIYIGQFSAVETLATQLVLAGPAPGAETVAGQGPNTISDGVLPISGQAVAALNAALLGGSSIDPTLKQAAALLPTLPEPPAAINPSADVSMLNLVVVIFLVWLVWLYVRPDYR